MLYIIVPVFNRLSSTKRFLASLSMQAYKNYTVIIVNDGSTDNTEEYLRNYHPEVHIVNGNGELFWGGSINAGLEYVKNIVFEDDVIAFANNDIEFEKYTITNILKYYENNDSAVYHPVTVNKNQLCESSGSKVLNWLFFVSQHPFRNARYNDIKDYSPVRIDFATARFLLFSTKLLKVIHGIDTDNFPHYGGDNDFSMRLKELNFFTYIIPSSVCILDTATTGNNPKSINSLSSFIKSLRSIKSTNNLKIRFAIGNKHCPKIYLPLYYMAILAQVVILNIKKK
jgi:GT2 family glycosyltransferase